MPSFRIAYTSMSVTGGKESVSAARTTSSRLASTSKF